MAYFLSHPIQYQSPLLRQLARDGLAVTTVYGDVSTAETFFDKDYGQEVSWEQPLLEGYANEVLPPPNHRGSWRGWKRSAGHWLDLHSPDAVWVHGWGTAFSIGCLLAAHQRHLPIMLRGETHLRSLRGGRLWRLAHRAVLTRVFERIDRVLAIGTANRDLYLDYGVPEPKITLVPYVADNAFFQSACLQAAAARETLRRQLDVPPGRPVLLFVGRLSKDKDLAVLLKALLVLRRELPEAQQPLLLVAGNGPLREKLMSWAAARLADQVRFLGFVPQTQLPGLYDLCDAFVLPSRFEPWGMVVNEAMNAGRPVVVSDCVGAGFDLVRDGWNGFRFRSGNSEDLAGVLKRLLTDPQWRASAGANSVLRINEWDVHTASAGMRLAIEQLGGALGTTERRVGTTRPTLPPPIEEGGALGTTRPTRRSGIVLAYIGVHEIFQLAIAAQEAGELEALYCSLFDSPGRWGHLASSLAHVPSARPLGSEALPEETIREIPLPLFARHLAQKTLGRQRAQPLPFHVWFERAAARRLRDSEAAIAVGSETCALHWFEAARRKGMRCILDCHGIPTPFLDECLQRAARDLGLPAPAPCDSDAMVWHKRQERRLADILLCCSDLQRDLWVGLGEPAAKMRVAPLWVDAAFWKPVGERPPAQGPLRVVAVGAGTLAKGLPYLLSGLDPVGTAGIAVTLVGGVSAELRPLVAACRHQPTLLPYMSREALRDFFATQHLLVMPSLGDSFGFVAMEAMACGLPVIVTEHCGVPVPDPAWRVPAHDAGAFAQRLSWYVSDPHRLEADSALAVSFARQFAPSEYRRKVREIYAELLESSRSAKRGDFRSPC